MSKMKVAKTLGNNVIVVNNTENGEIILVGKGIGFNKSPGSIIDPNTIEKTFILSDEKEKTKYRQLLNQVDDKLIICVDEVMSLLKYEFGTLPQELLVNLTDHVAFCISRIQSGMLMQNSILKETKLLYPEDYRVARKVCEIIQVHLNVKLPDDEVGLISLYIHSASNNKAATDVRRNAQLMLKVIELIENSFKNPIDKEGLYYSRFLHHLQFAIDRIQKPDYEPSKTEISKVIRESYPNSFELAKEIGGLMAKHFKVVVPESEISYLAIHLERIKS